MNEPALTLATGPEVPPLPIVVKLNGSAVEMPVNERIRTNTKNKDFRTVIDS